MGDGPLKLAPLKNFASQPGVGRIPLKRKQFYSGVNRKELAAEKPMAAFRNYPIQKRRSCQSL